MQLFCITMLSRDNTKMGNNSCPSRAPLIPLPINSQSQTITENVWVFRSSQSKEVEKSLNSEISGDSYMETYTSITPKKPLIPSSQNKHHQSPVETKTDTKALNKKPESSVGGFKTNKCPYCGNTYSFRSGLSKHLKKHRNMPTSSPGYITCHLCNSK